MAVLRVGNIDKRPNLLPQVRILAVFRHTDDFNIGVHVIARAEREVAANRVLAAKVCLRHFFADNCDFRRSGGIAIIELAPGQQWNSQSRKEIWSYPVLLDVRICVFRHRVALRGDICKGIAVREQRHFRHAHRAHTRQASDVFSQAVGQRDRLFRGITIQFRRHRELDYVIRLHSKILPFQIYQALRKESRSRQQHYRQRHL